MKRSFLRPLSLLAALLCAISLLAGCGSGQTSFSGDRSEPHSGSSLSEDTIFSADSGDETQSSDAAAALKNRKLVRTITVEMETKSFDALLKTVSTELSACGGYVEQSQTEGGHSQTEARRSQLTLRVPADKADAFLNAVGKGGTVCLRREKAEDVTLAYVDTQSHLEALRTEQKALLSLLEKAESLSDIVSLQSRLSEVRYEIESYQSQLRVYDNQVDYATVTLTVQEVERESAVPADRGTFETIGANLSDNFYLLGRALRSVFIWLVSGLPFWLLLALIAVIVILLCRRGRKRRAARRVAPTAPVAPPAPPTQAVSPTQGVPPTQGVSPQNNPPSNG